MGNDISPERYKSFVKNTSKAIIESNAEKSTSEKEEFFKFVQYFTNKYRYYYGDDVQRRYNPFTILENGDGVCEPFVDTTLMACRLMDIDAVGELCDMPNRGLHVVVRVKLDGKWYRAEVTGTKTARHIQDDYDLFVWQRAIYTITMMKQISH